MRQNYFETVALINARPEEIYATIADYRNGHPHIVPKKYFRSLDVESGGVGAGTIIRYRLRAFGIERLGRAVVTEPEPGRVLVETDTILGIVTLFTVTPANNGRQAHVQIASHWEPAQNIFKAFEQALYPRMMQRMYTQELDQIAMFVGKKVRSTNSTAE
jgi:hypothetical protein